MKRSIFLSRILALIIGTIILYGILNTIIFLFTASNTINETQLKELKPRAELISNIVLKYQQGKISKSDLEDQYSLNGTIWGTVVYVYDNQGHIIIKNDSVMQQTEKKFQLHMTAVIEEVFNENIKSVLNGQQVASDKGKGHGAERLLIVGQPIKNNGIITGAVFMTKPPIELATAFFGLQRSTILSALGVFLLMIFPIYIVTRRIVNPLRQMRDVAISMANGMLDAHASENYKGEIGELGHSLNYLSTRLSKTIFELEIERDRLRQTIDGLSEGIIALDHKGSITHVNPAIYSIFGTAQGEGRIDIIPDDELWKDFDTVLLKGYTIVRSLEWAEMLLRITICPLRDEAGCIAGAVGLFRDVTEAERLEQTRREYVANVSHELRTPISAIRAIAETLADDMVPDEGTKRLYYNQMLYESIRLSRLINDLLMLSRLQSGASIELEEFHINELLCNVADRYNILANEKGIDFSFIPATQDLIVISNMDMVEQVLIILLDNAIKYTSPGGKITIYIKTERNTIKVSVTDTGIGISPIDLPHIFERFYKADKAHAAQGTGLGLAIAFTIIEMLGEQIFVESDLGKGSIFTFTLSDNTESNTYFP